MKYYEREVVKFINSKVLQMWQAPNIFRNKRSITLIEIWIFFNRLCCYFSISLLNGLCISFVFKNWKRVLYSILNFIFEVQNTYVLLNFVIIDIERVVVVVVVGERRGRVRLFKGLHLLFWYDISMSSLYGPE